MKNRIVLAFAFLAALSAVAGWTFILEGTANPENRIAIVEDVNGDRIGVEPTSNEVWNRLVELYYGKDKMWIGGVVEIYITFAPDPNYPWGFHFKPDTIVVAEITAEGLQTTIRDIGENVDYWMQLGYAYVFANVVDFSVDGDLNDDGTVNIVDITIVAKAYGSKLGDENWNDSADLDKNDIVNILDISMAAKEYGKRSVDRGFGIYFRKDNRLAISDEDIVWYNKTSHEIKLTKRGAGKISALNIPVYGEPFVVKIDGEEIYNGTFMTPISSVPIASSEVVIVTFVQNDTIRIQMGYPGAEPADRDPRNNLIVLDFFQKTGKLIQ